ncbi:MAG: ribosomal L7Ae/L30e/S12e/Gadd45 family protein [Nitrososphaeria archaeon]|nr:ribosomal L7Ae/L30e/S12e/Gadd45 family protein [Nitrososphaeria archaeon]
MNKSQIEALLEQVTKKGKIVYGTKEVMEELKGSKAILISTSVKPEIRQKLLRDCKKNSIPVIEYNGSSIDLGRALGKNFRISVLSIKSTGGLDLKEILSE